MKLKTPILIINFKTYKESTGKNALRLAKICDKVAKKTKASIAVAVQAVDIATIAKVVRIPVLAQHIDAIAPGSHTGHTLPQAIKDAGAVGTLISHSEHHLDIASISETLATARLAKLATVVCARTTAEAEKIAWLHPDMLAIEPPELIGGKVSVSTARPSLIANTVKRVNAVENIPVLTGAGVKNKEDAVKSTELGAKGLLVASGIVKASNPEKALLDLIDGLK